MRYHYRYLSIAKWVTFATLIAAVTILRLYRLDELPHGISQDAGAHGVDALRVLGGEHAVFFTTNFGREGMVVYGVALATAIFGRTVMSIYLPTALASVGTVFSTWWMGQVLFDRDHNGRPTPWRSFVIGSVAAGLTAVSLSQTFIGRAGVRANFLPFFLTLCFALLWSGWRRQCLWRVGLAGACAGLLPYTYIPARLVPFLLGLWGLSFLPFVINAYGKHLFHHPVFRLYSRMGGVFVGCAAIVAAPILFHFTTNPAHFFMRSDLVSVLSHQIHQGDPLGALTHNTWNHFLAFGFIGDWAMRHNIPFTPMLTPLEASLFWMGVIVSVRHFHKPAHRLLVLWLIILMVPAVLARGMMPPPSFIRMAGVTPAVYLLIGVGLWQSLGLFIQVGRALPKPTTTTLHTHKTKIAVATGLLTVTLILVRGVNTHAAYFQDGTAHPRFQHEFNRAWAEAAATLNALPHDPGTAYLLPYEFDTNFGFEFLYQGDPPAHVFDARTQNLPVVVESALSESHATHVKLVQFSKDTAHVKHLLDLHATHTRTDHYENFTIHSYSNITTTHDPWSFHQHAFPKTIRYDGGITLEGFALGESDTQLPTRFLPIQPNTRSLWVDLQWRTDLNLQTDFAVSLRLHDPHGNRIHQQDQWLLIGTHYDATSLWEPNTTITTHIRLNIPPHVPPGPYQLRLIVYNTETHTPTVEIGTWEPEAVLTELLLPPYRHVTCNF